MKIINSLHELPNISKVIEGKLNALEGAIREIRWHYLPDEVKQELKAFYKTL